MVFEIEAWETYGDTRLGVEDLYVVTAEGCKKLSSMTPDIYEIA
jgi:Xaa-Pro aminopeptidase